MRNRLLSQLLLGVFCFLAILPVAWGIGFAIAYSLGAIGILSRGFTLEHWQRVFATGEVWFSFLYSFYIAAVTVILTVLAALVIALSLRARIRTGMLGYCLYVPLALPSTVAALFVFQMLSGAGFLSRCVFYLGLISSPNEFPNLIYDKHGIGIILTHFALATPFFAILFTQLYENEKLASLAAVAQTLGANSFACLTRVTLPILLRRSFANVSLYFIGVLGSFEIPFLLGSQSPQMISVLTLRKFGVFDLTQKPEAYIIAILYTALVLSLIATVLSKKWGGHAE